MLNTGGYKYMIRMCITYCFSPQPWLCERPSNCLSCLRNILWCIYECCQSQKYIVLKEHLWVYYKSFVEW